MKHGVTTVSRGLQVALVGAACIVWSSAVPDVKGTAVVLSAHRDLDHIAQVPRQPSLSSAGLPFAFTDAVIDSLALVNEMQEIQAVQSPADDTAALRAMVNIRVGLAKVAQALSLLQPFLKADDEVISESAVSIASLLAQVLEADRGLIQVMEAPATVPGTLNIGSKWLAQKDVALRLLPQAVAASANALVDFERSKQTQTPTLRVSGQEKARLVRKLEVLFGDSVKIFPVPGGRASKVGAALLWKWLNDTGWKPADAR